LVTNANTGNRTGNYKKRKREEGGRGLKRRMWNWKKGSGRR